VLPERDALLKRAMIFRDFIIGFYLTEKGMVLRRSTLDGKLLGEAKLPEFMAITSDGYGYGSSELFLGVERYTSPKRMFSYQPQTDHVTLTSKALNSFDGDSHVTDTCYGSRCDGRCGGNYLGRSQRIA